MSYSIVYSPKASKQFAKLPGDIQRLLKSKIDALANNPTPPGCEKLKGHNELYRIRQGQYRVVYEFIGDCIVVYILKIGHRGKIYRDL